MKRMFTALLLSCVLALSTLSITAGEIEFPGFEPRENVANVYLPEPPAGYAWALYSDNWWRLNCAC